MTVGQLRMEGREVFKHAVVNIATVMAETINELVGSQAVLRSCGFALVERIPNEEFGEILRYRLSRPG